MGRKAKFDEAVVPSGPGRKSRKQSDPTFPKGLIGEISIVFSIRFRPFGSYKLLIIIATSSERDGDLESSSEAAS